LSRWLVDVLQITDIAQPSENLFAVLESQDKVNSLTEDDAKIYLKLLICLYDLRYLTGIKSCLQIPATASGNLILNNCLTV